MWWWGRPHTPLAVIVPAPVISSIDPVSWALGSEEGVTIFGSNFVSGCVAILSGAGITQINTTFSSSTVIVMYIIIDMAAPLGARDLTVTNPDTQAVVLVGGFEVTA